MLGCEKGTREEFVGMGVTGGDGGCALNTTPSLQQILRVVVAATDPAAAREGRSI